MRRRDFLKSSAVTLSRAFLTQQLLAKTTNLNSLTPADPDVRRVLVMFKCHFDNGFTNTQAAVVHRYFTQFFPQAIRIAEESRQSGNRYIWTTGSWLLYEYLEQASPGERKAMEDAIHRGDIAWHAIPLNWQTEMMDASMISGSIALSHLLDRRFGTNTTGAKMTDVPGHTRGLISPLTAEGVKFLDIGVNAASTPADVPPIFLWKDANGASLIAMYHHGYGSTARVPHSDLAIAIIVRGDNSGPHRPDEIADIYAGLKQSFPNAEIQAATLTDIAIAVEPFRGHLPVISQEIGDTWIYGVASDPVKVARYREVARLRSRWIRAGKFRSGDKTDVALLRNLLLEPEHTWGTDTKTWLDFDHYTPKDLALMLDTKNYKVVEFSWQEKRQDLFDAIQFLPLTLRQEADSAIHSLAPSRPQISGTTVHPASQEIETAHYVIALDPATGAIHRLRNRHTGREWASASHPVGLLSYQTLSAADYSRFFANYVISTAAWAKKDFGKPNIQQFGAEGREWLPKLVELRMAKTAAGHRLLARLAFQDSEAVASGRAAFPEEIYLEYTLPSNEAVVHIDVSWFGKPATRMPEALWLTFHPKDASPDGWSMDKSGETISPSDVVVGGSRRLHAVSNGFRYQERALSFSVETLDAPLIALGEKSPLNFSRDLPDLSDGIHSNLFNNAWGTNYIMWFGEDMRFRYVVHA